MLTVVAGPVRRVAGKDGDVTARASGWTGVFTPPCSRPRTPEPEQALTFLERAGAPSRGVRPLTFRVLSPSPLGILLAGGDQCLVRTLCFPPVKVRDRNWVM